MYNSRIPSAEELPTSAQLLKSTFIAIVSAIAILTIFVLPSEYGIDPTGAGRVLGLTEMGEIKTQLSREAEADRKRGSRTTLRGTDQQSSRFWRVFKELVVGNALAHGGKDSYSPRSDEVAITLEPGEGVEVKLEMHKGDKVAYGWTADGAVVNFDLHGENEQESISYEKGRGATGDEGAFDAAFDGEHGWWWRNRTGADVTITLKTNGTYGDIYEYR